MSETERFIPKGKLSKKAKRALNSARRRVWEFNPVTRRAENKKKYERKGSGSREEDDGGRSFIYSGVCI